MRFFFAALSLSALAAAASLAKAENLELELDLDADEAHHHHHHRYHNNNQRQHRVHRDSHDRFHQALGDRQRLGFDAFDYDYYDDLGLASGALAAATSPISLSSSPSSSSSSFLASKKAAIAASSSPVPSILSPFLSSKKTKTKTSSPLQSSESATFASPFMSVKSSPSLSSSSPSSWQLSPVQSSSDAPQAVAALMSQFGDIDVDVSHVGRYGFEPSIHIDKARKTRVRLAPIVSMQGDSIGIGSDRVRRRSSIAKDDDDDAFDLIWGEWDDRSLIKAKEIEKKKKLMKKWAKIMKKKQEEKQWKQLVQLQQQHQQQLAVQEQQQLQQQQMFQQLGRLGISPSVASNYFNLATQGLASETENPVTTMLSMQRQINADAAAAETNINLGVSSNINVVPSASPLYATLTGSGAADTDAINAPTAVGTSQWQHFNQPTTAMHNVVGTESSLFAQPAGADSINVHPSSFMLPTSAVWLHNPQIAGHLTSAFGTVSDVGGVGVGVGGTATTAAASTMAPVSTPMNIDVGTPAILRAPAVEEDDGAVGPTAAPVPPVMFARAPMLSTIPVVGVAASRITGTIPMTTETGGDSPHGVVIDNVQMADDLRRAGVVISITNEKKPAIELYYLQAQLLNCEQGQWNTLACATLKQLAHALLTPSTIHTISTHPSLFRRAITGLTNPPAFAAQWSNAQLQTIMLV